jgi:hypothetical protein
VILSAEQKGGPWHFQDTVHLERTAGQREARKRWVQNNAESVEGRLAEEGSKLFLVAIPARSWAPTEVTIEQPPPRLNV